MTAPRTMRCARLVGFTKPLELVEVPVPAPGPGEVLIAVRAAGLCRTDLHLQDGRPQTPPLPLIPGHEIAGEVVALGPGSPPDLLNQPVLVYYYEGCGHCPQCLVDDVHLCERSRGKRGFTAGGGFAEYVCVPAAACEPLPPHADVIELAPLGCAGTTAVHAVEVVAQLGPADCCLVIGLGGVGLASAQVAAAAGAQVVGVDRALAAIAVARGCGVPDVRQVGSSADDLRGALSGQRPTVVIDTVGTSQTVAAALDVLAPRGKLVCVGYTAEPVAFPLFTVIGKEVRMYGSVGARRADLTRAVHLWAQGRLRIPVGARLPLAEANAGYALLRAGRVAGRLVFTP